MTLDEYLTKERLNNAEFGRQVGAKAESVRQWRGGISIPGKRYMPLIQRVTDGAVQPNDFYGEIA